MRSVRSLPSRVRSAPHGVEGTRTGPFECERTSLASRSPPYIRGGERRSPIYIRGSFARTSTSELASLVAPPLRGGRFARRAPSDFCARKNPSAYYALASLTGKRPRPPYGGRADLKTRMFSPRGYKGGKTSTFEKGGSKSATCVGIVPLPPAGGADNS